MMVSDVELTEGVRHRGSDLWVAVPEAEDAAVAVAVDETLARIRVLEPDPLPFPHDHSKAQALVVRELVGCDVRAKHLGKRIKRLVGLSVATGGHRLESTYCNAENEAGWRLGAPNGELTHALRGGAGLSPGRRVIFSGADV